jgi:hypothetical protein
VIFAAVLLTWLAQPSEPFDDARTRLAALSSTALEERQAAQTWLGANLRASDFPALTEFAATADPEARSRLTLALGESDAHLELAALLSAEEGAPARRIGEDALERMALRWWGSAPPAPTRGDDVWQYLADRFEGVFALELSGLDLVAALERLARADAPFVREGGGEGRLSIVVDPALYESHVRARASASPAPSPDWVRGDLDSLVLELVRTRRVYADAFALESERPWLWVHALPSEALLDGPALVRQWCRTVVTSRERLRGEAAARALANCGWPAPLPWLSRLWRERADRNALAGLLAAAAAGRVEPQLANAAALRGLFAEFERREAEPGNARSAAWSRDFALALARFPQVDRDGVALWELVANWADAPGASAARVQCARRILTGMRRAPESWRTRHAVLLAANTTTFEEWIAALRFHSAVFPGGAPALSFSAERAAQLRESRLEGEFVELCERVGSAPSSARVDFAALEPRTRALWIDALLAVEGARSEAVEHVRTWVRADSAPLLALGERLGERARAGGFELVRQVLDAARADVREPPTGRWRDLELLGGVLPMLERQRVYDELRERAPRGELDWALLGALARTGPVEAYAELVLNRAKEALASDASLQAPWVAAFAQAWGGALTRGQFDLAARLRRQLRLALRKARHPLLEALDAGAWPPLPVPAPQVLDDSR